MTAEDNSVSDGMARALAREGRRARDFIASNRSDTLLRLFDFLLEQSIQGHHPKESEIAEEVFQDGSNEAGQQGSRVRVGIYRLRKKLDLFYADKPGARLTIPHGEYGFVLETPDVTIEGDLDSADQPATLRRFSPASAVISILLLNCLIALLYFGHAFKSDNSLGRSPLWQPLGGGGNSAVVVIGDYFMFGRKQNDDGVEEVVQDPSINSPDAFYEYVTKNTAMIDVMTNEDLYSVSSDSLSSISNLYSHLNDINIDTKTSSELTPDLLKSSGIIYLGALDAISPLLSNPLFQASQFSCGTTCYELSDRPSGRRFVSDSPFLLGERIIPRRDYGYIASFPGPSGHQIFILSGTGDAGASQMVNVVADAKTIEQLHHRLGKDLRSFEALYQVRTMFNRSYGSTLLIARPINTERIWDKATRSE